ncbi:MAG: GNAT family N-acetyltransferase [Acidobacteriota bacterium]
MKITIRLAEVDDISELKKLITESVTHLSANYYTLKQINSGLLHVFGVDTQLIQDGTYFIAERENQIVGAGGWSKRETLYGGDQRKADQPDPLLDPRTEPARIRAFYIHPRFSRQGVGTMILQACEDAARAAGFKRVELAATLPGEPFYSAHGYQKAEEIPIETPDGESLATFRMTRFL